MRFASRFAASALLLPSAVAMAQDGSGQRPHGPPPEAYAACAGQSAGASVTLTRRDGSTTQGICELFEGKLAARPTDMRGPPGGRGGDHDSGDTPPADTR